MHMGPVELSVSDLERSLAYWQNEVGLQVLSRGSESNTAGRASLGVDRELVRLVEEPGARSARGYAGLYHVALLLPARRHLANWLAHAGRDQVGLEGLSDHAVSEAIYLRDPDEHGIEIYADRPREQWEGRVMELMTTRPLDVENLFGELEEPRTQLPEGTVVGHTHLCVAEIDPTVHFYRDVLGMDVMAQLGPMAAFLSSGGYHHHVGANVWESRGRPQAPAGTARLLEATILTDDGHEFDRVAARLDAESGDGRLEVQDPSGNSLSLMV
jgi:catechol 2,3-dioxygenase